MFLSPEIIIHALAGKEQCGTRQEIRPLHEQGVLEHRTISYQKYIISGWLADVSVYERPITSGAR